MRPFLRHGQRLLVAKVEPGKLRPGDMVLFCRRVDARPRIHRIRRIFKTAEGEKFLIRGDNLSRCDGIFAAECIKGVAVARISGGVTRDIAGIELGAGLLLAPLFFRVRELAIFILAFLLRFMYSFIRIEKARYLDATGGFCLVYSCRGWKVGKKQSSDRVWVHPLFAKTPLLKQIMSEK